MIQVLVVGSLNMDITVQVDRFPHPGETIHGADLMRVAGGKGMNQAVAAARAGAEVTLVGTLGRDSDGDQLAEWSAADGIDGELERSTSPTGTALIAVDAAGENQIIVIRGANWDLPPERVREAVTRLHPALVSLCLEIPMEAVVVAAETGRRVGARVVLNPSPIQRLPAELLRLCDVLVVNEHELDELVGASWSADPARVGEFAAANDLNIVMTRGADGAVLMPLGATATPVPAVPVETVDTTGCGDAFTGALIAALARGADLRQAAEFGCRVASMAATKRGAQVSYPRLRQMD